MKRVLIFSTQMDTTGGIENHLTRLCEHLHAAGVAVTFFCPDYRLSPGLDERLTRSVERKIVSGGQRAKPAKWKRLLWLLVHIGKIRSQRFSSIYINGQGSFSYWFWLGTKGLADRAVVHHHSSGDRQEAVTWPGAYLKLLQRAAVVIACSRKNAGTMQEILGREVRVIYCFSEPCTPVADYRPSVPLRFGFFGRLIPEKGVDEILALAANPATAGIEWHLWGSLGPYRAETFAELANVSYHGMFNTRQELEDNLKSLDCVVLLTRHSEGLPLVLLESMSAGVPWISADRGGVGDLFLGEETTRVLSRDFTKAEALAAVTGMAEGIRAGLSDRDRLVKTYQEKYHPKVVAQEWLGLFLH